MAYFDFLFTLELTPGRRHIRIESAEPCGLGPVSTGDGVMRRRFKQIESLEARLAEEARRLREQAKKLPPGPEQADLLRKARENEMVAQMSGWIASPGLQPPN
jgi:hypothetical protein